MNHMNRGDNYESIASLCGTFNQPYKRMQGIIAELGIEPAFSLSGVGYFDTDAQARLLAALTERGFVKPIAGAAVTCGAK
jgi:hypothetical protein